MFLFALGAMLAASTSAVAASRCERLVGLLGHPIVDPTTNDPGTTPPDNYPAGLPPFAFTPLYADHEISTGIQLDRRIAAGIMDALLPINLNARAYERAVAAALSDRDQMPHQRLIYRLYEVQNGNYIETYQDTFPRLELVQPHAQRAFHLLTEAVQARLRLAAGPVRPAWRLDRSHVHPARALPRALRRTVSGGW